MTKGRIYRVAGLPGAAARLVRAPNVSQAIRHVAAQTIKAEVASQDDLVRLVAVGIMVEQAGDPQNLELDL